MEYRRRSIFSAGCALFKGLNHWRPMRGICGTISRCDGLKQDLHGAISQAGRTAGRCMRLDGELGMQVLGWRQLADVTRTITSC
jgi:hypothetical protein